MFEHLSHYDRILVSGPQRSGTRIAAKMIAADTGHRYVDEDDYNVFSEQGFMDTLTERGIVIQCPSMSHLLHLVADRKTLVVMMMRDEEDIAASEDRIGWIVGPYWELDKLGYPPLKARSFRRKGGRIAPLKYARWRSLQRPHIPHSLELDYESLAAHPLWVPKEQRANFDAKQTAPDASDG